MLLGSHLSIRNGYLAAARRAENIGADCYQYFPKNPRSLTVKSFDQKDAETCAAFCKKHKIISVAHTTYPTNLAAIDPEVRTATLHSLRNDLDIVEACGSIGLIVHFGKHKGSDPIEGYKLMIELLNQCLKDWTGSAQILIENNAGQGVRMGTTFEEIVQIRKLTDYPEKIGFCLDTCHAFASGLWSGDNWADVEKKGLGLELGYFEQLKVIHLNDSVYGTQSYRDRHANIGKGEVGEQAFREFLSSPAIRWIPLVLETPEFNSYSHQDEINYIRIKLKNKSD
ncbi:deoxyribonuclease IV [Aneurinibacillus sp. Ricciae_BoGa-3]|uniref:deoxyribonuclease IV n=1 Tax=Aneurinibacillus sp. Ricciae_BoGa-3 TaxID=3022697 RepID=UPI0023405E48|nr:deoxyribonuclease IV [Aneurinibacillus sp. Ricciae_BoGa-3]WCK56644.1 deoxyribonuclease IV [Aneurinibacillus sp. Ricciae_BoGa-3]